ncbi:16S rRNA (guanine(966)-N(2))-methyltransferase RsmD [uncultured Thiothrix sp.]|uniref:16S rRNA (guanine(966)-N(2))-methyltransferase RsmD n=1 Tax=uncultured Thiothrix sp. TaxID=223185 RepID=UPI00261C00FE|nr:16S rRNA (guanine(966)-N(2))-methyltransferase RsmD [uncultured Thiothrix sp.]
MPRILSSASPNRNSSQANRVKANQLRIIGGQWRSRRLPIADVAGLRPTPDRVRETLFNWLTSVIGGARCLDLFAGSGALGFEALSREAAKVVFVEQDTRAFKQLQANVDTLGASHAQLIHADAFSYLARETVSFDVIFLDPPFRLALPEKSLAQLLERQLISSETLIYLEHEAEYQLDFARWGLAIHRQTKAGQVMSFLLKKV